MLTFRRCFCFALLALFPASLMNAQDATKPTIPGADLFEAREFKGADGKVLKYRLLKPIDFDADAKEKYPLVLFLHGAGERGDDNERQLIWGGKELGDETLRRRYPAFVLVPQCPNDSMWAQIRWKGDEAKSNDMSEPLGLTLQAIESLQQEFPIDENRLYGMGLSMGGFGTWDLLERKPGYLAAAIPICGGGDPKNVEAYKSTPIWVFHGEADEVIKPELSREMIAALKAAGGTPIYTEFPGVGHNSWSPTFENRQTWDWLFAQRKQ
jgi:predicted peptidase